MIADIFITTTNRADLLSATLESLRRNTEKNDYRLTVVQDGNFIVTTKVIQDNNDIIDHVLVHKENMGLGPSINQALSHIQTLNKWYEHETHGDAAKVAPFICYIQDDILVSKNWLRDMTKLFTLFEHQYKIGFASGVECVEHATEKVLMQNVLLKKWIRAANMFGRREYWMSMAPIPPFDPETGRLRAKPNDGMGSGVDWWFIRNHDNSVVKSGRTNLVIPGLMQHAGFNKSTWLNRELPESKEDKRKILDLYEQGLIK